MTKILPIRQIRELTLCCPVCDAQKQVQIGLAGYSGMFYCCKTYTVMAHMERKNPMLPSIKIDFTEVKKVRQPVYGTDPQEWQVDLRRNGEDYAYFIVNEYGEEVRGGGCWSNRKNAEAHLKLMIAEEIEAREQHGPEDGNPHTLPVE